MFISFLFICFWHPVNQRVNPSVCQSVTPVRLRRPLSGRRCVVITHHFTAASISITSKWVHEWVKPVNQWRLGFSSPLRAHAFAQLDSILCHLDSRRWRSKNIFVSTWWFIAAVFQSPEPLQRQKVSAAECHDRNGAPRFIRFPVFRISKTNASIVVSSAATTSKRQPPEHILLPEHSSHAKFRSMHSTS